MKDWLSQVVNRIQKINLIAVSIGVVYLWFGLLKFFPNVSPAEELARKTIDELTFGFIPADISYYMLAIWETIVGLLLISGLFKRIAILFALVHMLFTFSPLFLFPEVSFNNTPFSFTIIGQYIVKNIIIVSALLLLFKENKLAKSLNN